MRKKRSRKKTSKIWTLCKKDFQSICSSCDSIRDVLSKMGYRANSGTMFNCVRERIKIDNINTSHFHKLQGEKCGKIPLIKILINGSLYNRAHLKRRLFAAGLLKNKCSGCGNTGIWNGKPLRLQLEHKNGNPDDNRIKNLDIMCPNCHSQTKTFCGKNKLKV
jgi:hypothetical protein